MIKKKNSIGNIERPARTVETGSPIFTNVIRLPKEDSGASLSIVRLANCYIKPTKFTRRTAVLIRNASDHKKWTIRYVMGGGTVAGLNKTSIAIDYDGICELGVQYKHPAKLIVRKATFSESMLWLMNSPDLNIRLSLRLAVLGASLGVLSLFLAITAL